MTADAEVGTTPQEDDWRRFSSLSRMTNHWDRPGWSDHRKAYYWYLTFDSSELRELATECQKRLDLPYLDPVPALGLHLTMPRVGWADEVSPDQATEVAHAAASSCSAMRSFKLNIGPLSGSAGAVRFSVSPWGRVVALHRHLQGAISTVLGPTERDPEFRPHVGIAYCNRAVSAQPLIDRVSALRSLPAVTVPVGQVDLVLIHRENRSYAWTTVNTLKLDPSQA